MITEYSIDYIYLTNSNSNFDNEVNSFHVIRADSRSLAEVQLIQYIETINHKYLNVPKIEIKPAAGAEVTFIGAGVVNLISALAMVRKGYKVKIYSADPIPYREELWEKYGCTFAGNDARMFLFNESRHHHYSGNPLGIVKNDQYRKPVSEDGWLSCPPESLSREDLIWIEEYETYPQWIFEKIQREIVNFNKESFEYWRELIQDVPELFVDTGYNERLFRVYTSAGGLENGIRSENEIGALRKQLDESEISDNFECFKVPCESGAISGIVEVHGIPYSHR